ncbi:hypothetical protein P7C70_g6298, partial [Phenoliferia sp. Uapishka_3]
MRHNRHESRAPKATSKASPQNLPPSLAAPPPTLRPSFSTYLSTSAQDDPQSPGTQDREHSDAPQSRGRLSNSETNRAQGGQVGHEVEHLQNEVDRGAGDENDGGSESGVLVRRLSVRGLQDNRHSQLLEKHANGAVDCADARPAHESYHSERAGSSSAIGLLDMPNEILAKIMNETVKMTVDKSVHHKKWKAFQHWTDTPRTDPSFIPGPPQMQFTEHQDTVCEDESRRHTLVNFMLVHRRLQPQAQLMLEQSILLHGNTLHDPRVEHILAIPAGSQLRTQRLKIISGGDAFDRPTLSNLLGKLNPLQELYISARRFKNGTPPYSIAVITEAHLLHSCGLHYIPGQHFRFLDAPATTPWTRKVLKFSIGSFKSEERLENFIRHIILYSLDHLEELNALFWPTSHPDWRTLATLMPRLTKIKKIQLPYCTPARVISIIADFDTLIYLRLGSPTKIFNRIFFQQGPRGRSFPALQTLAFTGKIRSMQKGDWVVRWKELGDSLCERLQEREGGNHHALPALANILFLPEVYGQLHRDLKWAPALLDICFRLRIKIGEFKDE